MNPSVSCAECGTSENLLKCSQCKVVYYCSKEHQVFNWKKHKSFCKKHKVNKEEIGKAAVQNPSTSKSEFPSASGEEAKKWERTPITYEGSSETEILNAKTEILNPIDFQQCATPKIRAMPLQTVPNAFPDIPLTNDSALPPFLHNNGDQEIYDEICRNVIRDLDEYGVCVVDNFLGLKYGMLVFDEVLKLYSLGVFKDGQLVSNKTPNDLKTIRGDQIHWVDGKEDYCKHISYLINQVDAIIVSANRMNDNGKLGKYTINGRTKVGHSFLFQLTITFNISE